MFTLRRISLCGIVLALSVGCQMVPTGPNVQVYPNQARGFEQYQRDDQYCRHYAQQQVGETANASTAKSTVTGAAITAGIGAAAGAILGVATGDPGTGAAIGAATGGVLGAAGGAGAGQQAREMLQVRLDQSFASCMHAHGHTITGQGHQPIYQTAPASPPQRYRHGSAYPPPPPGYRR